MNKKELDFILQEGEGLKLEFKESTNNLDKELVAFANSEGGRIFLGVSDEGKIKDIGITNKLKSQIQDIANNCDPSIKIRLEEFNKILIIHVEEGKDKPYKCKEGFFIRTGPNSQKMKRDDILNLFSKVGKLKFDELISEEVVYPKDFDKEKFSAFLKKSSISKVTSTEKVLASLSLGVFIKNSFKLNNAGVLLFAKIPSKFLRQNFVTCVLYKGKEKVDIIDRKDFKESLIENYENTFSFLRQHLRLEYEIKGYGPRKEIPEIPYEALREAVINAIIHRDYFEDRFGIFVEIFDDRVEITNKGKLLFDRKELGKVSVPRNPIIFDMFHRMNLIEKVGSGINRIKNFIRERGLKVKFETDEFFRVIFYRPLIKEEIDTKLSKLNPRQIKAIEYLKENNSISITQYITLNKVSDKTARRDLSDLVRDGIIVKEGATTNVVFKLRSTSVNFGQKEGERKGGYWKIIERGGR